MTNCKYCKADCIFRGEQQTKECKGYIPMTNADRIRAMTDEELAHFLAWHWNKKDYGLEWLKQPAEVANEPET